MIIVCMNTHPYSTHTIRKGLKLASLKSENGLETYYVITQVNYKAFVVVVDYFSSQNNPFAYSCNFCSFSDQSAVPVHHCNTPVSCLVCTCICIWWPLTHTLQSAISNNTLFRVASCRKYITTVVGERIIRSVCMYLNKLWTNTCTLPTVGVARALGQSAMCNKAWAEWEEGKAYGMLAECFAIK